MNARDSELKARSALSRAGRRLGRRGQVLDGMWAGKNTKEIAADLGISTKTVEYHRTQLYRLFRVDNPVSLCRQALARGVMVFKEVS
jgi:DNA-binding NarL/FixJ family response regulator